MALPEALIHTRDQLVCQQQLNGKWNLSAEFNDFPELREKILAVRIMKEKQDELIWTGSHNGTITVKEAFNFCRGKGTVCYWLKGLWRKFIPPRISVFLWKILNNRLPTAELMHSNRLLPSPVCLACITGQSENIEHIFITCDHAVNVWTWIEHLTGKNVPAMGRTVKIIQWCACTQPKDLHSQLMVALIFNAL